MSNADRTIHLVLTHHWYDMIESGQKPEEYRDFTPYWCRRFFLLRNDNGTTSPLDIQEKDLLKYQTKVFQLACAGKLEVKPKDVVFQRAYHKNPQRMRIGISRVYLGPNGKAEWGAVPGKWYIIIKLCKNQQKLS